MLTHAPIKAVVIGASAGAIGALRLLIPALPADFGIPVLVVVHLPPRQTSVLCEIFAPMSALPVREAVDKESIVGGGLWFSPPDYHLLVESQSTLALSIDEPVNFSRPAIDVLFETAALAFGQHLVAIVLTGASSDGALGAACVRRHGGVVAVQSPESAEIAIMPEAAIGKAAPQFVGTVTELAAWLVQLVARSKP